jgi:hypothetical protein
MTVTHKNPSFDATIPAIDFDAPGASGPPTGVLPVKTPEGRWVHRPDLEPEE